MTPPQRLYDANWLFETAARLRDNRPVRRGVGTGGGRLHVERQLPFLIVHRQPHDRPDVGTRDLVTASASWLQADTDPRHAGAYRTLVREWARTMTATFGACALIELWTVPPGTRDEPMFRVVMPRRGPTDMTGRTLTEALRSLTVRRHRATAELEYARRRHPPRTSALLTAKEHAELRCTTIGVEIAPPYVDAETGEVYPLVLRTLRRRLGRALHRALYEFATTQTRQLPDHYHALGRNALSRATRRADAELAAISDAFDFLLICTPLNTEEAWREFRGGQYRSAPTFHYRALRIDPALLKRRLYAVPLEDIDDPAISNLLRTKRAELDRQLTLLVDRQTPRFLPGAIALYGDVAADVHRDALKLLRAIPPNTRERRKRGDRTLDAEEFAAVCEQEFDHYRREWPGFDSTVTIRDDIPSGLMVSRGHLLIGRGTKLAESRVQALIQHEIGTHVLTYLNGREQVFRQLAVGLDGYDAFQEGLAVLAEHLVGGLSPARLRLLAARVVAARSVVRGATFVETFRLLHDKHGFAPKAAFGITMRVHRSGGLPKDAVYLAGLRQTLSVLRAVPDYTILFVGKIAVEDIGTIRELLRRDILRPPRLVPRYLQLPEAVQRLDAVRKGARLLDLVRT